jgi:hypothetical protein
MQLNDAKCGFLAAAALALLGNSAVAQEGASSGSSWKFDLGTLLYAESDGRVKAFEPKVHADKDLGDGRGFGATATVDVVSGASPNGAAPAAHPQTFSSASGSGSYTIPAYQVPKDPTFKDQRAALDLDYRFAPGALDHVSVSANVSTEHDYFSIGAGTRWAHDFNRGNTTLGAGVNFSDDTVIPIGGVPTPLAQQVIVPGNGDGEGGGNGGPSSKGKQVLDAMLGVTQLLSPKALVELNYSLDRATGYLNDPYKVLSVVDASADPLYYVNEARPSSRLKQSIYAQYKYFVRGADVLDTSYRFMTDDWGIRSHTVDLTYRWNFSASQYLEPHLRWYRQTEANFYHAALDRGQDTQVQYASADPRLGAFNAYTGGIKYGSTLRNGYAWSIRLEYYTQRGQVTGLPTVAGAALSQFNLAPSLNAAWAILGFSF